MASDANANSSPDPDAAARRRSGRVVKAPDRLAPEPSQKRKRDGAEEEDDVPELDEDESDVPDPESDEEPTPARKPRKSQSKKPASKKPKINGAQPAAAKRTMTLPRMPKKPVRLDTNGKGNALYTEIFGSGKLPGVVAQQWLEQYRKDEAPAMLELINCVLLCVGCNAEVTVDDVLDPDNIPNRLADLQDQYQEQQETEYPLISKARTAKSWRELLVAFFTVLIDVFHESELLYKDKDFIENVLAWLGPMSSTTMRPFRHTATTISLAITTGLVEVAQTLDHRITNIEQQLNASKRSTAKAKSFEIGLNLNEATEYRKACGENLQFFFDTVFVHRYRDTDPKIRCECVEALGTWIVELPGTFKLPQYLRYLGWMLSDASPSTRQEVLKQLAKIFKNDSESLGHFIERFRPRLVEMATRDADVQVRIAALAVMDTLRKAAQLEPDEIDTIGELIFDSDLRVRKAVVNFFVACLGEALEAKVEDIGGNDVLEEFDDADEDDFDSPRKEWLDVKCLAETLANYDARIEERQEEHNGAKLGVAVDLLGTSAPETRVSLAAQVLYDKVSEVEDWQILAGYLLHDHTTSSRSTSRKKQKAPEAAFKKAVAPEPAEEVVLLKILASAVKSSLAQSAELDRGKRKGQRMEGAEQQEQTAIELASLIPSLLDKFASDPETATIVLRLEHSLNLGIFQQLRQDSSKYEKLLDEVCAQFTRHDDSRVIAEAAASLLHARQHEELEELVDQKLSNLWETSLTALRSLDGSCELSVRGNLDAEALQTLRNILIKVSKLASIADCVDVMDVEGGDDNQYGSSSPIVDIICQLVHRGKYEPQDEEIDELEDEVVSYAIKSVQFYFMWRTHSISKLLSQGSTVSDTVLNRLSVLRQTYRRFLIETLSSRAAIDNVRLFATGSLCDLHLTFATLRQPIKNFRPASSSGTPVTAADGLKVLTQEVEPALVPELMSIFDGAEKSFAKKTKRERALNRPADDEELESEAEEEEEDEDMDSLPTEQRAAAQLAAEKALCELTGKFVMAISAKVLDNSGPSKGRLRRRMLRNQAKLGNNFKEVLNYLDEDKLLRKLGGNKKPSGKPAAAAQAPAKSAEVIEDDEDEENLYENSDKGGDLDEDPIEDEPEEPEEEGEQQQKNNDVDDDILGD